MNLKYYLLLGLLLEGVTFGQETPIQEEEPPKAKVSIMALGFRPNVKFKKATQKDIDKIVSIEGETNEFGDSVAAGYTGAAILQLPDKGAVPPASLELPLTVEEAEKGKSPSTVVVGFNSSRGQSEVFANRRIGLKQKGEDTPFVTIPPLKKDSDNLILLIPRGKAPGYWLKPPKSIHYDLSTEEYVGKNLVVKNLTGLPTQIELHDKKVTVRPGKTHSFEDLPTGKRLLYRVSVNKGKSVIRYTRIILYEERLLVQLLLPQYKESKTAKALRIEEIVLNRPVLSEPEPEEKVEGESEEAL